MIYQLGFITLNIFQTLPDVFFFFFLGGGFHSLHISDLRPTLVSHEACATASVAMTAAARMGPRGRYGGNFGRASCCQWTNWGTTSHKLCNSAIATKNLKSTTMKSKITNTKWQTFNWTSKNIFHHERIMHIWGNNFEAASRQKQYCWPRKITWQSAVELGSCSPSPLRSQANSRFRLSIGLR